MPSKPPANVAIVDKLDAVVAAIGQLTNREILVGVPSTATVRADSQEINNAAIGYWMEFGVPEQNIPARPSLVPGIASVRDRLAGILKRAGQAALDGHPEKITPFLMAAGEAAVAAVKMKIRTGPFVPLAEATIRARLRSDTSRLNELYMHSTIGSDLHVALTGTQPLIDKGYFLNSFRYVVRKIDG